MVLWVWSNLHYITISTTTVVIPMKSLQFQDTNLHKKIQKGSLALLLSEGVCGEISASGQQSNVTKQTHLLVFSSPCQGPSLHFHPESHPVLTDLSSSIFSSTPVFFHLCHWRKPTLRFPCHRSSMMTTTGWPNLTVSVDWNSATAWIHFNSLLFHWNSVSGLLRPMWVLESCRNGAFA